MLWGLYDSFFKVHGESTSVWLFCLKIQAKGSWTNMMDGPKPNWMRQAAPLPCECDKCFFCLNSLTTGVDHKRKRRTVMAFVQHDRSRTKTIDCTDERVDLQIGSSYCKQYYRKRPGTRAEKMNRINTSRMGCPSCEECICKSCWDKDTTCTRRRVLDSAVVHWILVLQTQNYTNTLPTHLLPICETWNGQNPPSTCLIVAMHANDDTMILRLRESIK